MRNFLSALAAIAAVASPTAAIAQDATVTVRISLADLDLSTSEGRAAAEARLDAKLRDACTSQTKARYRYGRDIVDEACFADARSAALAQVERIAADNQRIGREVAAN